MHHRAMAPASVAMPQCPAVPCFGCGDNIGLPEPQIFPRLRTAITEHSASCGQPGSWDMCPDPEAEGWSSSEVLTWLTG